MTPRRTAALACALALLAAPVTAEEADGAASGEALWARCKGCHSIGAGARNRVGPHLNELFGRRAAAVDGFRYSDAMRRAGADGLTWTAETLDVYLENPKTLVTGTRMSFRGIENPWEREALIAWLRDFTVSPSDIPEAEPTAAPTDHDLDPSILAIQGDPDYGAYLSSECTTCHQVSGADEGIPSITGWPAEDFVIAMQAYKRAVRPHPVMQMIAGRLSDEEIASLAVHFEGVE